MHDAPARLPINLNGIAEIVANVSIGRHTHPGPESGYMLEGEMVLMVQGQPDKTVKMGEVIRFHPAPFTTPRQDRRAQNLEIKYY